MDRSDVALLEKEFCPPIDTALFSALLSDYDLSKADSVAKLRTTLTLLKEGDAAEYNSSFEPFGTSGAQDDSSLQNSSHQAKSSHRDSLSDDTALTSLSRSFKSIGIDDNTENEVYNTGSYAKINRNIELEELPAAEKSLKLKEMFPTIKGLDIEYVLKKVGNNFGKAVEELLNRAFFEEEGMHTGEQIIRRGVDGLIESSDSSGRRARARRKRKTRHSSLISNALVDQPENTLSVSRSRWDRAREDIEFITRRTYLSHQTVSSVYHKSGASLPSAIAMLCVLADSNPNLSSTTHSVLQAHISELSLDFPMIPLSQTTSLVYLAHPSTASAHELARILATSKSSTPKITPHYLPRPPSPPSPKETIQTFVKPPSTSTPSQLASTRDTAIAQAHTAYRQSKSKPLMAGAASYYSSVARDATNSLRLHEAAAADTLVASQSRPGEIDLHGVNVQDAVRIARLKTEAWWQNGASEWALTSKARGEGLKIVTGLGRHSEGKRGRLGPAVGGMLVREGWKVEFEEGAVMVVGKVKE